jgi:NAD(P)-dependent dehydrogenase (short-subunit alcohol dehydrogenase family)
VVTSLKHLGPGGGGYAFAKQVVAHYVNDLALQLAPGNIRVNAIHPTNVNTDPSTSRGWNASIAATRAPK